MHYLILLSEQLAQQGRQNHNSYLCYDLNRLLNGWDFKFRIRKKTKQTIVSTQARNGEEHGGTVNDTLTRMAAKFGRGKIEKKAGHHLRNPWCLPCSQADTVPVVLIFFPLFLNTKLIWFVNCLFLILLCIYQCSFLCPKHMSCYESYPSLSPRAALTFEAFHNHLCGLHVPNFRAFK